jgi:Tol biopolymer transport system component
LLSSVRPDVPAALDRIVATSLAKDPDDRWQSARDLLRALTWLRDGTLTGPSGVPRSPRNTRAWLAAAAVLIAAIGVGASFWIRPAPAPTAASVSFSIQAPEGTKFPRGTAEMAISPDGTRLVFVALEADGRRRLWIREFDSVNARVINGTDGARYPFWSPDSSAIGFFVRGTLKRIAEAGGESVYVCDAEWGLGGTWNSDGTILFGGSGPIRRVSATGGTSAPVTSLEESRQERSHAWPVFLGDGRRFLYLALTNVAGQTTVYQGSLDSTEKRPVLATESNVGISGTQLFWYSNGSLLVQTYDGDRAAMAGQPVTVADHIRLDTPLRSGGAFAVGTSGALAFRSASPDSRLVWVDRQGRELSTFPTRADYQNPWLSPDEKRLAIEKTDPSTGRHAIWILDLERGTTSRLLFDASGAHGPGWSPDGSRIVFASNRLGGVDLYSIRADGAGGESLLVSSPDKYGFVLNDWSRDGRLLLFQTNRQADLGTLLLAPGERPRPILDSVAVERHGQFSPDTKWIAYSSDESGTPEVYVRRFPSGEGKWQISTHGGAQPRWRRDAKELFYLAADGALMSVAVGDHGRSQVGSPRLLFRAGLRKKLGLPDIFGQDYTPSKDGQRFLLNHLADDTDSTSITVVTPWPSVMH